MAQERFDLSPQIGPLHPSGEMLTALKTVDIGDCLKRPFKDCEYLLRYVTVDGELYGRLVVQDGIREVFAVNVELHHSSDLAAANHSSLNFYTRLSGLSREQLRDLIHEHAPRREPLAA